MPNQAWYDGLKKGFNPDGTVNKSFTYLKDGKNTYADGSPAPTVYESSQAWVNQQQDKNKADAKAKANQAWAPYGGAPPGSIWGSRDGTDGYVQKTDGSDSWKYNGWGSPQGMKNPIYINGKYYDMPKAKATPAANLSGGQASVPSVEQRMSRMGQAVQKGVNKGKIKSNQLGKYQVPGQQPTSPLVNQLGKDPGNMPNKYIPDADGFAYRGAANKYGGVSTLISTNESGKNTPVPMPQKALTPQAFKNLGYS
jgi:hypothetical protein